MNVAIYNKYDVLAQLAEHKASIMQYGVKQLGLFGSFVRDEATIESGVDFLVGFEDGKKNYDNYIELAFYLENLLNRKIELVTRQSPYIGRYILSEVEDVF